MAEISYYIFRHQKKDRKEASILRGAQKFFVVILFGFILFETKSSLALEAYSSDSRKVLEKAIADGKARRYEGDFAQSIQLFKKALELAKKTQDQRKQVDCLINLGVLSWNSGLMEESSVYYKEALILARNLRLKDKENECSVAIQIYEAYSIAKALRSAGHNDESIHYFKAAINLAKRINSVEHELKCLRQMSFNYSGRHHEFARLNEEALKIARDIRYRLEEGRCLNNIGVYYWKTNKYSKAIAYFKEALMITQEADQIGIDKSSCLNNLGVVYRDVGDYDKSLSYLKEALKLDTILQNDHGISMDLNNIGEIVRKKADILNDKKLFFDALHYYSMSLELSVKQKYSLLSVYVLNNIGLVYQRLGSYSVSLEYLNLALQNSKKINAHSEFCNICNNIGRIYLDLGNSEEAQRYFQKSLDVALLADNYDFLWETYCGLGQCLEERKQFRLALTYYKMAVDVIDAVRSGLALDDHKAGFARDKVEAYESLLNLLYKLAHDEPAGRYYESIFQAIEKSKARAFMESLKESEANSPGEDDAGLKKKQDEISKKISKTISQLTKPALSEITSQELLQRLEKEEDEYFCLLNKMKSAKPENDTFSSLDVISLEGVQKDVLDEKTAILEFFLGRKKSYALLITKKDFVIKELPPQKAIEDSLRAYLKMISTPPSGSFRGILAAKRLYKNILFPFEEYFRFSVEHLVIVPDGVLYYLPFETLIPAQGERTSDSRYLIESYRVSYVPSASSLAYLINRGKTREYSRLLLAMGNPVYSFQLSSKKKNLKIYEEALREVYLNKGFDFSPLPFSKKEVKQISRYFPKNKIDIFIGAEAKEEVVKKASLAGYQIVHFACHGLLDEKASSRSALVLTLDDNTEEDGFLQVREIHNLKLNASLAVLSACQTGRGRLENGEGIFGLPRVFFYAGTQSTLSTLWKVNDKSTADFMRYFYQFLKAGNDKANALRLAKIRMIRSEFSHPFFWAAFILNGDHHSKLSFH
ncbi:MAG: CHAT domain-containing protein [Clostridiales bacterium]|nr:CHAT domain-containing protein [Clostridiales bacterium]